MKYALAWLGAIAVFGLTGVWLLLWLVCGQQVQDMIRHAFRF